MKIELALALFAALALATGCEKGAGDPCRVHADCEAGLVCSASGLCGGCGEETSCLGIDLVVKTCDPTAPDVLAPPVTEVRVTLEGDGMLPMVQTASPTSTGVSLKKLPFGKNRRLLVEAFADPAAPPVARGESVAFDLSADTPPESVTVFVRRLSRFAGVNSVQQPTVCSRMNEGRADHSATVLQDGRVLIAGGYRFDEQGEREFLQSVEIYEPRTGNFVSPGSRLREARAGHTAHLLPDGRVILIGGYSQQLKGELAALRTAEVYDPQTGGFEYLVMKHQRMQHASVMLPNGVVVIAGGMVDKPLTAIELFLPQAPPGAAFSLAKGVELKTGRVGAAGLAVSPERVLFVGGTDGKTALSSVEGFVLLDSILKAEDGHGFELKEARAQPSAFLLDAGDGPGVVVVGAPASGTQTSEKAWDWLPLDAGAAPERFEHPVPLSRFFGCTAPFPGGALVAGGVKQGGSDPDQSLEYTPSADVYRVTPAGDVETKPSANPLLGGRKRLVCTTLADGSVLVTGGEAFVAGKSLSTDVAEIFVP